MNVQPINFAQIGEQIGEQSIRAHAGFLTRLFNLDAHTVGGLLRRIGGEMLDGG